VSSGNGSLDRVRRGFRRTGVGFLRKRRAYVAELGGDIEATLAAQAGGEYLCRAVCMGCSAAAESDFVWQGPEYKLSRLLRKRPLPVSEGIEQLRHRAALDVANHCDRFHGGALVG